MAGQQQAKAQDSETSPKASAQDSETSPKASADEVVEYVGGSADVVKISKADWAKADVEDQEQVEWNTKNKFKVPTAELSAAALDILSEDSRFKLPKPKES